MMRSDLSIMVVRGVGKVRRFKASSFLLIGSSLFFAVFIVFSIFAINEYFAKRRETTDLTKKITELEKQRNQSRKRLHRMRQQVALLKDYIRLLEKPSSKTAPEAYSEPLPAAEKPAPEKDSPVVQEKPPETPMQEEIQDAADRQKAPTSEAREEKREETEETNLPAPEKPLVAIENLTSQHKNTRLTISFRLAKTTGDKTPLRGYLHMILVDKNVDPPQIRSFPHEVLKGGIPVSYKRGQVFVIKHFRVVHGKFFLGGTKEAPASLRIFVYDKDGVLLLDRKLTLKNAA
jgi:outer membrane biosynthesis protein TonB